MIKVSILYPTTVGETFDHAYYRDNHMPMVADRLGKTCKYYTVDMGFAGDGPNAAPPFVAMCHIYCETLEEFQSAFAPNAAEIFADVAKYTSIIPITQISEVVVEQQKIE